MTLSRRAALGAGLVTLLSTRPAAASTTLRVGTFKGQDELILKSSGQQNFPYGVDYHYFSSGQLEVEALNANALDYGGCSEIPLAFAAAAQAEIKIVATLRGDVNDQVVLVPKNSPIQSIADLKGKRVGYVRATTSQYYLLRMLWQAGLDVSDIQAINLSPSDGAAAFAQGALDAWAIYGYAINFAQASNGARILRTAKGILSGNYFVAVQPAVLTDPAKRAAVANYLVRIRNGYAWVEANKAAWCATLAPVIHVPLPFVQSQFYHESQPDRVVPIDDAAIASAQQVADTFIKAKLLPGPIDVAPYFDRSFGPSLAKV
jgi:sulfonate transport system substrate-binding protein